MNSEKLQSTETINYTMQGIKKKLNPNGCSDTTSVLTRRCPTCDRLVTYTSKQMHARATRRDSSCRSCNATFVSKSYLLDTKLTAAHRKKCSDSLLGTSNPMFGKSHTTESRMRISQWKTFPIDVKLSRNCPTCKSPIYYRSKKCLQRAKLQGTSCIKCSRADPEYRKNLRERIIDDLKSRKIFVNFNPSACEYFDTLSISCGWKLQHAKNGGEIKIIGYSLDAYDSSKNVVIEYDEPRHYDVLRNLKLKDVKRMQEIINHTNCHFYRYNEQLDVLSLYTPHPNKGFVSTIITVS